MSTSSGQLNAEQRDRLLTALLKIPSYSTYEGRTSLLSGLDRLGLTFARSTTNEWQDLQGIIAAVGSLGAATDGTPLALPIIDAALALSSGSQVEQELRALREELVTPADAGVLIPGTTGPLRAVALAPDGRQAVTWSLTQTLALWDLTTQAAPQPLGAPLKGVTALALVPSAAGVLELWVATCAALLCLDLPGGQPVGAWACPDHLVTAFCFAPDRKLLVGTQGGVVAEAELTAGELVLTHEFRQSASTPAHSGEVVAVLISPDQFYLSATKNSARQWRPSTYQMKTHWPLRRSWVVDVALLPDGDHFVYSEGTEGKEVIRVCELEQARLVHNLLLPGVPGLMPCVAVAADGRTLAAGTNSGALCFWPLPATFDAAG